MEPIIVDGDLRTRCGICSVVCPSVITVAGYDGGLPLVGREYAAICLQCGHFQAFCPTGALTLNLRLEERMPCRRTRARSPRRRSLSILKSSAPFTTSPAILSKELISAILDIARYAASGGNSQPVQ